MSDKEQRKAPVLRFKGFTDDWEQRKLNTYLSVSKAKNREGKYTKQDVLSVSGDFGIVNQIKFQGRSFAGKSVKNYKVVRTGDIVYTKSPLKTAPYGIIKANSGVPGIVSTLYAVYNPKENADSKFVELFFNDQLRLNKYLKPIVNIGAKHDMKVKNDEVINHPVVFPNKKEQLRISQLIQKLDDVIFLQQRKLNKLKSLRKGIKESTLPKNLKSPSASFENTGKIFRFSELFKRSSEKNDGSFSKDKVISVANMRWGTAPKNSSDDYMKTYFILRKGDIAFEGNRSKNYSFGRFVANDLEDGIVSHVFIVYRPKKELNLNYLKYYINDEQVMRTPLRMSTSRTTMMTNLVQKDIVKQKLLLPSIQEQNKLGELYKKVDALIQMNQLKLNRLNQLKQFLLQKLFV